MVGDRVVRQHKPGPLLARLRAGQPAEVMDWQLPAWARRRVQNIRVRV